MPPSPGSHEDRRRLLAAGYGADADAYDRLWSPVILPAAESLVHAMRLDDARLVVDVGAGAGALTPTIRRAAKRAAVVGVDAAARMLQVARARRRLPGIAADAALLPVAGECADAVVLAYVLFHLTDPDAGLADATRALRRGGQLGTVTWAEERATRAAALWDEALDAAGAPAAPTRADHAGLDSPAAMGARMRRAGLIPRRAWTESIDHTFEPEEFWQLRVGFGGPRWRLDRLEASSRSRALTRLRQQFTDLGRDDFRFRGEVVLAIAERPWGARA